LDTSTVISFIMVTAMDTRKGKVAIPPWLKSAGSPCHVFMKLTRIVFSA